MRALVVFLVALVLCVAGYTIAFRKMDNTPATIAGGVVGLIAAFVALLTGARLLMMLLDWVG